jgi:hypothetical protein
MGLKTKEHLITVSDHTESLIEESGIPNFGSVGRSLSTVPIVNDKKLHDVFIDLYLRIRDLAKEEIPLAKPLALAEALKTRVISKGPPFLYTVLKPLQVKLWSVLKSHPCFSLIGKPVDDMYVQERMGAKLKDDQIFLSVDYTDATNEMYSWVSDVIVNEIVDCLSIPDDEAFMFKTALTGHILEYNGEVAKQERGQLMGSIVSFPILCIANAAICRMALEADQSRVFTLRDCPLAINGDDAIMKMTRKSVKIWETIGSYCGLSPSIGKVYESNRFLNINSTTYNYSSEGFSTFEVINPVTDVVCT